MRIRTLLGGVAAASLVVSACTSDPPGESAAQNDGGAATTGAPSGSIVTDDFTVTPGVQLVTVTDAEPGARLTLVGEAGDDLLTLSADERGQVVFAYVPAEHMTLETGGGVPPTVNGEALQPGTYSLRDDSDGATSDPFRVPARDDHPDPSLYDGQTMTGAQMTVLGGVADGSSLEEGFNYLTMRDGTKLSAMVRLPDQTLYGPGPYPTVIEYNGYGAADPDSPQPGSMIATAFGFATVGVDMRGVGCSGGVFDVFNPAQQADGYDVVEIVARQPWVKHNKVGMIGLSYSGITQLFVASTKPPSLAAIAPLSVIEDPWKMAWSGGIYNAGFTKQWLEQRDRSAAPGGMSWTDERIEAGDSICEANQQLRSQNIDFEAFTRMLEFRPGDADGRDLSRLVSDIEVPVYLTGAFQDEQTGPRFATMLGNFTGTDDEKFVLFNGHHPDGYAPYNLSWWYDFLSAYVAQEVPRLPDIVRAGAVAEFEKNFKVPNLTLREDRFADLSEDQYDEALARWEADPTVRVLFEWGAGRADVPGAPVPVFEAGFDSWPPPDVEPWELFLGPDGALEPTAPSAEGVDTYRYDPEIGLVGYTTVGAYDFIEPQIPIEWQPTADGTGLSYVSAPIESDTVIAGPGHLDLYFGADAPDADIEVVLSEITPDGNEVRIQNGILRAGHRKVDAERSDEFSIQETFTAADYQELPADELTEVVVPIFPVAHVLRPGSRLRVQVNNPGGDLPLWLFENPDYGNPDATYRVGRGGATPSRLVLPVLPGVTVEALDIPAERPPCGALRGQPCRPYVPLTNTEG